MKKAGLFIFTLIILSSFVVAMECSPDIPPSIPKTYYGLVSYNETTLMGEYEIRAMIEGDLIGIGNVINGEYLIDLSPCSGKTGIVIFSVNSKETKEMGEYNGDTDWGKEMNLDLTLNEIPPASPSCGNGLIEPGEECDGTNLAGRDCGTNWQGTISCTSSCKISYANCVYVAPSNGGSSGGSSGGSGGSSGGGGSYTPATTSSSSTNTNKTPIVLDNKTSSENSAPITGSAISDIVNSKNIIFAIIGGVTLVVLIVVVVVSRKKKSKPVEEKEEVISEVKEEEKEE